MKCDVCNAIRAVTISRSFAFGRVQIEVTRCVACWKRERLDGDERATTAIDQAEKAGIP